MHPSFEIDAQIHDYLDGHLALSGLKEWFRAAAGALLALHPESEALEFATALQLALIEFDQGSYSERQLKQHLRKAINTTVQYVIQKAPELTTSSNDTQPLTVDTTEPAGTAVVSIQLLSTGT
jgi:hypothetical protein